MYQAVKDIFTYVDTKDMFQYYTDTTYAVDIWNKAFTLLNKSNDMKISKVIILSNAKVIH